MRGAPCIEKPPKGIFLCLCDEHGSEMAIKEFVQVFCISVCFSTSWKLAVGAFFRTPYFPTFSVLYTLQFEPPQH